MNWILISILFYPLINRDGRFRLGDEIINVNGKSLRGLTMEEAKSLLKTCGPDVDIILARDPVSDQPLQSQSNTNTSATPSGKELFVWVNAFIGTLHNAPRGVQK